MKGFVKVLTSELKSGRLRIVKFYPYTSVVWHRIVSMDHNFKVDEEEELKELWVVVTDLLEKANIRMDNKVAVKVEYPRYNESDNYWKMETGHFFIGRYDGIVSVGLAIGTEKWCSDRIKDVNYEISEVK